MSVLRLDETNPYVQAYYKKKKAEEAANRLLHHSANPKARLQAKGRMKEGKLNKTEQRYQKYLNAEKEAGRVSEFWFESMKFKIASNACWYTPDFMVLRPDGTLELHEVKGSPRIFADDAKVKVKTTADKYPFKVFLVYPERNGWKQVAY